MSFLAVAIKINFLVAKRYVKLMHIFRRSALEDFVIAVSVPRKTRRSAKGKVVSLIRSEFNYDIRILHILCVCCLLKAPFDYYITNQMCLKCPKMTTYSIVF